MAKSNATLREVGTTNRTRVADYERAINEKTRLLLRVHRSNFQITGFTEQPALEELAALARKRNIPLMEDLGSGALFDLRDRRSQWRTDACSTACAPAWTWSATAATSCWAVHRPACSAAAAIWLRSMRSNSLFRALRVDKLTYAALEATLLAYVKQDHDAIPALRMMHLSKDEIGRRRRRSRRNPRRRD